jgi:hypothetical protein
MDERKSLLDSNILAIIVSTVIIVAGLWIMFF